MQNHCGVEMKKQRMADGLLKGLKQAAQMEKSDLRKKAKRKKFKTAKEFGAFLGLSELDMELVQQKKKLIEKLKKARLDQEISQAELARMTQTKQPAIARMESGLVSQISFDFLAKVALVLNVSFTFKRAIAA